MGVRYFYFSAANSETAKGLAINDEDWFGNRTDIAMVALKGIDHIVMFGQLIAFIRQQQWDMDTVKTTTIWPPPETKPQQPEDYANLPPDSPWTCGPYLEELDIKLRDDLAGVEQSDIAHLSQRWAQIDEWYAQEDITPTELSPIITDLVNLAKQSKEKNEMLFVLCEL